MWISGRELRTACGRQMNGSHDGRMRRVLPEPADEVSVADAYAAPLGSRDDRPWVGLCMVTSVDGSTVMDGTSGELSSPTDIAVLARLRAIADVIVVGAGTARDEGYGPPKKPGQRVGVVSRSGAIDFGTELFGSGAGFVITSAASSFPVPSGIDVIRCGEVAVDFDGALRALPDLLGECRVVQVEGGASLNASMFDVDVFDELNITTSPVTVGGIGPRLALGAAQAARRYDIAQLAVDERSFVFTRWLRRRGGG